MYPRGFYKKYYNNNAENIPRSTSYYRRKTKNVGKSCEYNDEGQFEDHNSKQKSVASLQKGTCTSTSAFLVDDNCTSSTEQSVTEDVFDSTNHPTSTFLMGNDCNSSTDESLTEDQTFGPHPKSTQMKDKKRFDSMTKDIFNGINVGEVILIIMNIMKKHSLAWTVVLDIFLALNFIFKTNIFPVTKYKIKKLMKVNVDSVSYHFICQECNKYLGKYSNLKCSLQCECGNTVSPSSMGSFFIEMNVEEQLNNLLSNPVITNSLDERFSRQKKNLNNFEDIYDGLFYRECSKNILQDRCNFSYTFNTDGCQPAEKTKITAWPIFLMLHELPDYLRKKFMVLAGLWVAKVEPNMNIFLQPFVDAANRLSSIGLEWLKNGENKISKLFPLGCCVDSVARCAILNMKRFNGTYGCTFCEHPTVRIDGVTKYPMVQSIPRKRTDDSIKFQMIDATTNKSKKGTVGVWGTYCLLNLHHFNLSKGMIVDFMHSCLLGVAELYTNIIMTTTGADYYVGSPSCTHVIDERLLKIKPPTCIAKVPTSICHRNNWKASDYLIWILFGALPSLSGLLPIMYLNHLALFVTALSIFLQDSISVDECKAAEKLLVKFVFYFNKYFGDKHMNYNVHLLLHISDTVKNWGPLWTINTFPFESQNKKLLQMKKSNYHIAKQISFRLLTYQQIPQLETEKFISDKTRDFCEQLNSNRLKKVFQIGECTLIGRGKRHQITEKEILCLRSFINVNKITECKKYQKMIYQKFRFTTSVYSENKKRNDSAFETKDNRFGIITSIYLIGHNDEYDVFLFFKLLKLESAVSIANSSDVNDIINLKKFSFRHNDTQCIKYDILHRPCVVSICDNNYYISSIVKGAIGRCIN